METDETAHIVRIYINGVFCGQSEVGNESSCLRNGGNVTLALGEVSTEDTGYAPHTAALPTIGLAAGVTALLAKKRRGGETA